MKFKILAFTNSERNPKVLYIFETLYLRLRQVLSHKFFCTLRKKLCSILSRFRQTFYPTVKSLGILSSRTYYCQSYKIRLNSLVLQFCIMIQFHNQ